MYRILIAEDQLLVAESLEKGLQANGFQTTVVNDGQDVLSIANSHNFDLLILDINLPKKNGFQVLEELRRRGDNLPIIILTGSAEVSQKVAGLEGGADDYVTKPFHFEELLARVRVQLREQYHSPQPQVQQEQNLLRVGDITLDLQSRQAWVGHRLVDLSVLEFNLVETFLRHPGQVLSRNQLLHLVWGYNHGSVSNIASNVVDVYVGYLRKKLGSDKIVTVRGIGYRLSK